MLIKVPNNLYIEDSSFTYAYTVNSMTITGASVATDHFVTAHLPDQPTVGQSQDIYGEKTFYNQSVFNGVVKFYNSVAIYSILSVDRINCQGKGSFNGIEVKTGYTLTTPSLVSNTINSTTSVTTNTLYAKTLSLTSGNAYYTIGTDKTYFQVDDHDPSTSTGINIILTKNNTTDTSSLPSYRILPTGIFTHTQGGPPDLGDSSSSGFNKIFCKKLCQSTSTDPITFSFGSSSPTEPVKITETGIEVGTNRIKITEQGIDGLDPSHIGPLIPIGGLVLAKKYQNANFVQGFGNPVDIDPEVDSQRYCTSDLTGDIGSNPVDVPKGIYIAISRLGNTTNGPILLQRKTVG